MNATTRVPGFYNEILERGTLRQLYDAQRAHAERTLRPLEDGSRGTGEHAGILTMRKYTPGWYPACTRHGALVAVGGGKWRCLTPGCNIGAEWERV